ncbi:S1 family peptidase [Arenibacterium sp. CAU 1754]
MRYILALILTVLSSASAMAEPFLDRPAPLEQLRPVEVRFLQALLAGNGRYTGLIDGAWGRRSLRALNETVQQDLGHDTVTVRDLATLARPFQKSLTEGRWQVFHDPNTDMSYLLPLALVIRQPGQERVTFLERRGELLVRTRRDDAATTETLHKWVIDNALTPATAPIVRTVDRRITAAVLSDKRNTVYLRSHRRGQDFVTTRVRWHPKQAQAARIILASISLGKQPGLVLPEGGLIQRAILALAAETAPAAQPTPVVSKKDSGAFAGTAFYINNTDLLTATAVLRMCRGLKLGDGTALTPLENTRAMGAVVVTSPARSRDWLPLAVQSEPQPQSRVFALGYPLYQRGFTALVSSHGQVDGQNRYLGAGQRRGLAMPFRPGNLGAPVLDASNRIIAVMVGRPANASRALPDQLSLAAPTHAIADMLYREDVFFDQRDSTDHDGSANEVRNSLERAVVPVFCR